MLIVSRSDVGASAFDRLVRERLLHEAIGEHALPRDVRATVSLRWRMIEPWVPAHTWVTGLAALWLHGFAPAPAAVDVVGSRGLHRVPASTSTLRLVFHSGSPAGLLTGRVRSADVTRASMDALAHSPAHLALPAVYGAIAAQRTSRARLEQSARTWGHHSRQRARVISLVTAIAAT